MKAFRKYFGDEGARSAWVGVGAPILGLVVVIIALAVALIANFARQQDRVYVENTQRLVTRALNARGEGLVGMTIDFANWDTAFANVSARWNETWVKENIYSSVADAMFVLRADGVVGHAWFAGEVADPTALQAVSIASVISIPDLRRLARAPTPGETGAYTYATLNGRLIVIAVSPVTVEDSTLRRNQARVGGFDYIAAVDVLDDREFAAFAAGLDLGALAIASPEAPSRGMVHQPVVAANGDPVAVLEWVNASPGAIAFQRLIWPVVLGLLLVGALTVLIARRLVARQIEAIATAKAAQESSLEKSEFLGRVSNELRTPLVAVIGYAELIQEETVSAAARADAQRIIDAARALSTMLSHILDQSRIDADNVPLKCEVVPVAGMLAEVQGIIHPVAHAAGVRITVSQEAVATYAFADYARLRQCLTNIVGNAVKFSPRGGNVRLRARLAHEDGADVIVIEISDSGLGIAAEEMPAIFRPFAQANAAVGAVYGGTGLGLSIARALAREMGGDIAAISAPGEGSTFYLRVPAATAQALSAA